MPEQELEFQTPINSLITKSIFSKTRGRERKKGWMVRASEELTHILHLAAKACSPGQEFLGLVPFRSQDLCPGGV